MLLPKESQGFATRKGFERDVRTYIRECDACQCCKYDQSASPRLLQPLPIATAVWTEISMDFIKGLLLSTGKGIIMVVVDRLTKYAHFIALKHPFTAATVANAFLQNIFKLHGLPRIIVSDRALYS